MKNQSEEIGVLRSAKKKTIKKNWAEEAKETARKSSSQGRKVPLKKNNTTMKKNLAKSFFITREKDIKGRICREISNNAMLKRREKRKQ